MERKMMLGIKQRAEKELKAFWGFPRRGERGNDR
jgi:hypothetical protein